jgi:hypothetical protein
MIVIPGRGSRIAQAFVAFGNRLFQHLDHRTSWTIGGMMMTIREDFEMRKNVEVVMMG